MTDKYAADLPPHPLVTGLTSALSREALKSAVKRLQAAARKSATENSEVEALTSAAERLEGEAEDRKNPRSLAKYVAALDAQAARKEMAAKNSYGSEAPAQLAAPPADEPSVDFKPSDVPALSTFAGYLGDAIKYDSKNWRILYLDNKLSSWLCVEEEAIVFHDRMHDRTAAYGMRDVIWLKAEATVGRGIGPQSGEARFLRGSFTSAGDVTAAVTGGTFDAATGIFCEAQTPGCCGWPTHH